jgi:hypothetical protein
MHRRYAGLDQPLERGTWRGLGHHEDGREVEGWLGAWCSGGDAARTLDTLEDGILGSA